MDQIIQTMLISGGTGFVTSLASKSINGPVQTLDDIWELVFGGFNNYVNKKRAIREKNLNDFKDKIANEIKKIPNENIQEPSLNIIGPALEASKYYIEEKDIRNIFAKLIASSMDDRNNFEIHNSYVEIIKQLTSLDAKILSSFKYTEDQPICEIRKYSEDGKYIVVGSDIFLPNNMNIENDIEDKFINQYSISISNLSRLGLVIIDYSIYIPFDSYYNNIIEMKFYKDLNTQCQKIKETFNELSLIKGKVKLTPIGNSFVSVCL